MHSMGLLREIKKLAAYLVGKRSELQDLDVKDMVMAKVILDIHRSRTHKEVVALPLFEVHQIHRLDRDNAIEATNSRAATLRRHRAEILEAGCLSCELLARHLPSLSWIKVVEEAPGSYLAFEGNGRVAAMQQVFGVDDDLAVEVELYHFKKPGRIIRGLNRVRRMNGLI